MPAVDEVRAWYNQHYAGKGLQSMRPRQAYRVFLDLLAVQPGATLLDVSCGPGFLLEAAQGRGVAASGVDLSDEAVRLARRVCPQCSLVVGAGEYLAFADATFDYVTCLGSLEHFLDMAQGLREMLRVARPAARFCIMVPNQNFLGWRILGHQGTAQQDINEQLLSLAAWRRIFREHGLDVLKVIPDRWHAVKWRYGSPRGAWSLLKGLALEAAWRLLPLVWEYQFIFLLERAPSRSTPATGR